MYDYNHNGEEDHNDWLLEQDLLDDDEEFASYGGSNFIDRHFEARRRRQEKASKAFDALPNGVKNVIYAMIVLSGILFFAFICSCFICSDNSFIPDLLLIGALVSTVLAGFIEYVATL